VVVGSGAAGLAAALAAAAGGAEVLVLERSATVGGTTAMSGGVAWLPGHGRGRGTGAGDDAAAALRYLTAAVTGDADASLLRAFVDDAARVALEIDRRTPLEWEVLDHWPDYRGELPGASTGGRSMWPRPLRLSAGVEALVQPAFDQPTASAAPGTAADMPATGAGPAAPPDNDGVVLRGHVRGRALVGGLLTAVLDAGVEVRTGARAGTLVLEDGGVTGVVVDGERLTGRVVLASGGFQHDAALRAAFLPGAPVVPMGPAGCAGDAVRMAQTAGAVMGNMDESWWMPAMSVPGETVDGTVHYRPLHAERAQPGAVMVDASGRRFVDEAQNYGDVGRAMRTAADGQAGRTAADGGAAPAVPWWLVFDAAYRRRYSVGPLRPGDPDPGWLRRGDDFAGLAAATGLPPDALEATVARFNEGAARGADPDFGRGTFPYDCWIGDARAPHPTLGPLDEAPFYALAVHLGSMGTKGGPRTDDCGRVLRAARRPVAGLYAAGNAAASPFGTATVAGGATLGPALVFGFRAGERAAGDR